MSSKIISIKLKKIKVVKDWPKPKLVHNIQVFLSFTIFYWQFIQTFGKIAAPLTSILKMTRLPNKPAPSRNNNIKLAFNINNNNKLAFKRNNSNSEVYRFGVGRNNIKHAKKSEKSFKSRKSKSEKIFKSWNLAKLRKKLLKSGNSTNFDNMKTRPKFLTLNAKIAFNSLWLAFIKAPIL